MAWKQNCNNFRCALENHFIALLFHILFQQEFWSAQTSSSFSETGLTWRVDLELHKLFERRRTTVICKVEHEFVENRGKVITNDTQRAILFVFAEVNYSQSFCWM